MRRFAWALSPVLLPPDDDLNTEDNADLFYSPYMNLNTEDNADYFYQPYLHHLDIQSSYTPYIQNTAQYNSLQHQHSLYHDDPAPGSYRSYPPVETESSGDLYDQPYLSTLTDYSVQERQDLPTLAQDQQYEGPLAPAVDKYDGPLNYINDADNEIFDVPKVLLKLFKN